VKGDRVALAPGIFALLVWPLSYAWIPSAGRNPDWIGVMVPIAEWGSIVCAVAVIWLGFRARRSGEASLGATWAPHIGLLTLGLMTTAFLVVAALYRGT
jgi:hypothetical protein